MKYATVCSGIEAPSMAWHPLGWEPVWFSEIDRFPSAVLKHHYPSVPDLGDMTKIKQREEFKKSVGTVDLFCGGTPCQSFSVAGLRKGMDDPRGNLALVFLGIVDQLRPRWVVWENVPGVLSSNGGRDFGSFLGALGQLGYGWAYRILDAQYFGVPQRRRRVFVVGHLGSWRRAAAVLFELHSLQGHPAPRREAGQGFAADVAPSLTASGRGVERTGKSRGQDPVIAHVAPTLANTLTARTGKGVNSDLNEGQTLGPSFAYDLRGRENGAQLEGPHQTANIRASSGGSSRSYVFQSKASATNSLNPSCVAPTIDKGKSDGLAVYGYGVNTTGHQGDRVIGDGDVFPALSAQGGNNGGGAGARLHRHMQVRRLTPRECERLQGFPDNYTRIPYRGKPASQCPDGPRYKSLGNSMAVPVMRWIGERIQKIDAI